MDYHAFGSEVHRRTRADAEAEGRLRDVTASAVEAGFNHPTAVTAAAWADAVAWPFDDGSQDDIGRLWDVLSMARLAIRAALRRGQHSGPIEFTVYRRTTPDSGTPTPTRLQILLHGGDHAEPVFTISLPDET